ncbi:MAG: PQQ-binding-like beta-propeller repeat protein [Planctomycetes bacterium]|nr:PQQ-binding-like beta-propeller repeat protein [Planctomycetota bacterium]MBL7042255.1 PQQ-binding-like beta-propeller repeat protein [Pirellulaceae bacterium]
MKKITAIAFGVFLTFLSASPAQEAKQILDAAGVKGGLVVAIGCDNPALLAGLRADESYLVHGLDTDPGTVVNARSYLREKGLYGPITVSRLQGPQLPYVDNLVNLVVVSGVSVQVSGEEIARVLAPGGVALMTQDLGLPETRHPTPDTSPVLAGRTKFVMSWPQEIDEWTHYLYDASNNAVSNDTVVAPPRGLQWTCGPEYARSHEHFGSVSAMVSTAGRVFYIIDEGPISSVFLPPEWKLVARDAFSGVLLWQRPIANWESQLRGFRSGPPEIGRRLIANGECIYVTLGYGQPVTVLDAATGEEVAVFSDTEGASELLSQDGVLYVLADDMTAADHDERKKWINETAPTLQGYQFPKRPIPMYGKQRIIALDIDSGKSLWKKEFEAPGEIMPTTLAVADGRVCFQTGSDVVCLDAGDGKEAWRSDRPIARSRFSWSTPTLVMHDGVVLTVDRLAKANADETPPRQGSKWLMDNTHQSKKEDAELVATSLEDGKELWRAPCFENYDTQLDIFVIDDVVWVGDLRHKRDAGFTQGRDLRTGKVVAEIPNNLEFYDLQMGHHRCYRNKATVRYLLLGRDGIEFVDPRNGTGEGNWWVRGTCQYGIMPANGLVYVPQHSCGCHPQEKLNGFNTLAPARESESPRVEGSKNDAATRLERGPAYGQIENRQSEIANPHDWPTYRRDARRSGFQDLRAPQEVAAAWTEKLAAPVTAPVVADGKVFVAETDRHTLHALSAQDGKRSWSFDAEGRIDSPPTISGGLCLFGTRNGFVYCLRAADGELVWRFRAGPQERLVFSYEQLESAWPVHGSVLVDDTSDGTSQVYFAAGRSSHLDGGVRLYALDRNTGEVLHQADVTMAAGDEDGEGVIAQRALPDILSLQSGSVFMRDARLTKDLAFEQAKLPHLYAPGGFLDNTWWHRTYWVYGTMMMSGYGGWPRVGNVVPSGRLLVFDGGELIYGYGRIRYQAGAGHVHPDAAKDYKLFAEVLAPKPKPQSKPQGKRKPRGPAGRREVKWSTDLPFVARAIVLSQDTLLVAGGNSLTESAEDHGPGTFWIASRGDGAKQGECELPAPPVLDGMALSSSGVFVSMIDGSITSLRNAE